MQSRTRRDAACVARVVIRTEQHQQMDEILTALHRAVSEALNRVPAEARR